MSMVPNKQLSIRKIDTEVFIYDRNRSFVHTFNKTGAFIWNLFEQGVKQELIINRLMEAFEVDAATAQKDVAAFFTTLHTSELAVERV